MEAQKSGDCMEKEGGDLVEELVRMRVGCKAEMDNESTPPLP